MRNRLAHQEYIEEGTPGSGTYEMGQNTKQTNEQKEQTERYIQWVPGLTITQTHVDHNKARKRMARHRQNNRNAPRRTSHQELLQGFAPTGIFERAAQTAPPQ